MVRVPRIAPGTTLRPASLATLKAPRKNSDRPERRGDAPPGENTKRGPSPPAVRAGFGAAGERPLGEEHDEAPFPRELRRGFGVGEAAREVVALDEQCAEAAQQAAGYELTCKLALAHEGWLAGQHRRQHQRVGVARVVE